MSVQSVALLVTLATAGGFALLGLVRASQQTMNLEDYMVSRNRFGPWMSFATVVASALGVWILFSPPQVGASSGIAGIVGYCLGSAAPLALFTQIGPRLRRILPQGHSLNEFVLCRFGNAMYLLALGVIVFYMFIYLAAELTAIAKAVQILADVPLGWTALVVIAATFLYTTYGGLGATIFTDAIQFAVMVPLLLVSFLVALAAMGGWEAALQPVRLNAPQLLSLGNVDGIKFGATLVLAIVAAEVFNQANWQRVYASRTDKTVQQAFLGSAVITLPLLMIAGALGLLAASLGFTDDRAFFSLLQQLALPLWFTVLVLVLALALVMSTLSSLLNGIASVFTIDLIRLFPQMQTSGLLRASRLLTVAVGLPAIAIAARGFDVLYLFLLADLVCAGAVFPVIWGLYSRRLTGQTAFFSALAGIGAGALFFPKPDFSPWNGLPFAGDLLVSFAVAIAVSAGIALVGSAIANRRQQFDFATLGDRSRAYAVPAPDQISIGK
ncbi:sodium:solute symporter family transporter [Thermoleptolyngbya sp. PKUAC-SCTB121]|uniref:sodium:solute symporter family transporter n=1 Tax=Thermoleptolyngbya sp. PKUAC-SCTB121 TaxID=2811482 RepID=UPI00196246BB|nr:Na+/proline symporter [Thermoleptolyngbya sp. PKUAC-SCTB121]